MYVKYWKIKKDKVQEHVEQERNAIESHKWKVLLKVNDLKTE